MEHVLRCLLVYELEAVVVGDLERVDHRPVDAVGERLAACGRGALAERDVDERQLLLPL
jgi:hypothetical protein